MDPFVPFALTLGMVIAASQQAAIMEQYAARTRHIQTVAVETAWNGPPAGYLMAPAAPPVACVETGPQAALPDPRRSAASREFIEHWQNFMQPSVSRAPLPAGWGR